MKVLQVNCVYKKGSTGKIVRDLHSCFVELGIESVVCYGRGEDIIESNVYKTCGELYSKFNNAMSRVTGILYGACHYSTSKLIQVIKQEKPDIVHLHCINGYFVNIYRLLDWLKANRIRTVLTLHAEFMYTGGCGYSGCPRWRAETGSLFFDRTSVMWKRMRNAFNGFETLLVTSVSPWLQHRAEESVILKGKRHTTVLNGVDTATFCPQDYTRIKRELELDEKKVLLHVTANFRSEKDHLKGGYYILELAKLLCNENIQILVAGMHGDIPDVPKNITFVGTVLDQKELARYYSMADVTVLTSSRETFSMVTAESLCCGTPVVGFYAGGPESIAIDEYCSFVDYGDIKAMKEAIIEQLGAGKEAVISEVAASKYSKQRMVNDYLKCYEELMKN